jgi:hypothetical protein
LYVTLVIYQESLHDARSTKYKISFLELNLQRDKHVCNFVHITNKAKIGLYSYRILVWGSVVVKSLPY